MLGVRQFKMRKCQASRRCRFSIALANPFIETHTANDNPGHQDEKSVCRIGEIFRLYDSLVGVLERNTGKLRKNARQDVLPIDCDRRAEATHVPKWRIS
jgi:hypothetical protein